MGARLRGVAFAEPATHTAWIMAGIIAHKAIRLEGGGGGGDSLLACKISTHVAMCSTCAWGGGGGSDCGNGGAAHSHAFSPHMW